MVYNTANKGARSFGGISKFDIGDFLVDLFHSFDKSSKLKESAARNTQYICLHSLLVYIPFVLGTFCYEPNEYLGSDQPSKLNNQLWYIEDCSWNLKEI